MSSPSPLLVVRKQSGVTIIGFAPGQRVFSRPSVENMAREFDALVADADDKRFIVSFEGVEYMSSTVLGVLVSVLMRIYKGGGELRIACVTEDLELLFRLTGLHKVFEICPTFDSAIKSLGEKKKGKKG